MSNAGPTQDLYSTVELHERTSATVASSDWRSVQKGGSFVSGSEWEDYGSTGSFWSRDNASRMYSTVGQGESRLYSTQHST